MIFRSDINAMRALAVGMVIAFHFYPGLYPSGYLGVDVFFVISGFLMTAIVLGQLGDDEFSLSDFYRRRWLRVAPVLLALSIFIIVLGYFLFPDVDYRTFGKHSLASLGFFSNFIFYREVGSYFDDQTSVKWLLHTWSLAVEFQFYIIYPILLALVVKVFSFRALPLLLSVALIASYVIFIVLNYYDRSAAFYMLPARFWEFLAGALAYLFLKEDRKYRPEIIWPLLFLAVLLLGVVSYATGLHAILANTFTVLIASVMLITGWGHRSVISDAFNSLPINYVGKVSYSLYVWHWPIAIIALMVGVPFWGVVLSLLVALVSYWLIEKNLGNILANNRAARFSFVVAYTVLMVISAALFRSNGLPDREYPESYKGATVSDFRSCDQRQANSPCVHNGSGSEVVAVVGDSLSLELTEAIAASSSLVYQYSFSGCNIYSGAGKCLQWSESASRDIVERSDIEKVYVIFRIMPLHKSEESQYVSAVVDYLKPISEEKDVVFLLSAPTLPKSSSKYYFERFFTLRDVGSIQVPREYVLDASDTMRKKLVVALEKEFGMASYLNLKDALCNENYCRVSYLDTAFYFDNIHLSRSGYVWALDRLDQKGNFK